MFGAAKLALFAANPPAQPGGVSGGTSYWLGGYQRRNTIRKYNHSTDATSTAGFTLADSLDQISGFANSTTGVGAGGSTGSAVATAIYVTLSSESTSGSPSLASEIRDACGGSSTSNGYVFGGYRDGVGSVNTVQKYSYSGNTWSNTGYDLTEANMTSQRQHGNNTISLIIGGYLDYSGAAQNAIRQFAFSNDAITTPSFSLGISRAQPGTTGDQSVCLMMGGWTGDYTGTFIKTVDTCAFADGTRTVAADLAYDLTQAEGSGDDVAGVIAGGVEVDGVFRAQNERKYTYSTGTHTQLTNALFTDYCNLPGAFHSLQID